MQEWETTLDKFRQFGGIAENVRLGHGKYGRGLFPIDKSKPVKLQVPEHLLVPAEWLKIDDSGCIKLTDASDWSAEKKDFYLNYLAEYSLTSELIDELLDEQKQLYELPDHIKTMLINYGIEKDFFCEPNYQAVLKKFIRSRRIIVNDGLYLMPLVELVNHSIVSKHGFTLLPYVGIAGQFKDEVLVNYGAQADAMNFYFVYGFSEIKSYAFSGTLSLDLGPAVLNIARLTHINQVMGEVKAPQFQFNGQAIDLSFLLLANSKHKTTPKIVFNQLMKQVGMPKEIANEVFDGLVMQNIKFLKTLLIELTPLNGKVADALKLMVKHQLVSYGVFA